MFAVVVLPASFLPAAEPYGVVQQHLRDALSTVGLAEEDLNFKKDTVPDRNLSPLVRTLLSHPLKTVEFARRLEWELDDAPCREPDRLVACEVRDWKNTPAEWRPMLQRLFNEMLFEKRRVDSMFEDVPDALKNEALRAYAMENFHVDRDARAFDFWSSVSGGACPMKDLLKRADDLTIGDTELIEPQLRCGRKLRTLEMRREVRRLLGVIERFATEVVLWRNSNAKVPRFGKIHLDTALGMVVLGDEGSQHYDERAALIVDLGGNDTYERAGCAMGTMGLPFSVAIDLGGDDRYHAAGSGVCGVGVLFDQNGNDRYEAADASLGCGLFGAGAVWDVEGDDHYTGDTLCEGAAAFGFGLLWNGRGRDVYDVAMMGQGFAGVNGLGVLRDDVGNDRYHAGGKYPDYDRYSKRTLSLSQGFSIGYRPFAPGGLGVLMDSCGDDHYECDVFGQGSSYWYSCGVLIDRGGNDSYKAYQYAQGTGIHLSVGILKDDSGDDVYHTTRGLAQAGCHDFAVGLLWEGGGDDSYTAESSSQGSGISNAVGIHYDASGNDAYRITAGKVGKGQGSGDYVARRGIGSVGLLLDASGRDAYSSDQKNNHVAERPEIGAAVDVIHASGLVALRMPWAKVADEGKAEEPVFEESVFDLEEFTFGELVTDDVAMPPRTDREIVEAGGDPVLERLLLEATMAGDVSWKVAKRERAKKILEAIPVRRYDGLLPWVGRADSMIRVVVDGLLDKQGKDALPVLRKYARSDWWELRGLCVYWLGEKGGHSDAKLILPSLDDVRTRPASLLALSKLGTEARSVRPWLDSERGLDRALVVRILGQQQNPEFYEIARMLDDPDWNVRTEAVKALRNGGDAAVPAVKRCRLTPLGRFWSGKIWGNSSGPSAL